MNLNKLWSKMRQKRLIGVDGDADALGPAVFGVGLGATTETKRNRFSQELEMRKERKLFKLCLVKRKIQISIYFNKSCFNSLGNSYIKASYIMVFIYIK